MIGMSFILGQEPQAMLSVMKHPQQRNGNFDYHSEKEMTKQHFSKPPKYEGTLSKMKSSSTGTKPNPKHAMHKKKKKQVMVRKFLTFKNLMIVSLLFLNFFQVSAMKQINDQKSDQEKYDEMAENMRRLIKNPKQNIDKLEKELNNMEELFKALQKNFDNLGAAYEIVNEFFKLGSNGALSKEKNYCLMIQKDQKALVETNNPHQVEKFFEGPNEDKSKRIYIKCGKRDAIEELLKDSVIKSYPWMRYAKDIKRTLIYPAKCETIKGHLYTKSEAEDGLFMVKFDAFFNFENNFNNFKGILSNIKAESVKYKGVKHESVKHDGSKKIQTKEKFEQLKEIDFVGKMKFDDYGDYYTYKIINESEEDSCLLIEA